MEIINKNKFNDTFKLIASKKISATDIFSIIITTMAYFLLLSSGDTNEAWAVALLVYRLGVFPSIFAVKSLLSKSYKPIGYVFQDSWDIVKQPNLTDKEKYTLLKDYLEKKMEHWLKYWIKFKTIVCQDTSWKSKWFQIKELLKEIYRGEINLYQLIWMILYYVYAILIVTNILAIPGPFDLVIALIFLAVIYYATGDLVGLGTILVHIFTLLSGMQTEDDIRGALLEAEKDIKTGAQVYYFYTADKNYIEVQPGVKVKLDGGTMTKEEIDLEDAKEESQALGELIETAKKEKAELNGEIAKAELAIQEQEKKE